MGKFIDTLRQAILDHEGSRYSISRATGISESVLSRFVRGERGLSGETIDVLMDHLGLEVRPRRKARRSR